MAEAYATVASGGIYCAPTAISKITDARRQVAAGAVGRLPPGAVERRRQRRQLHPAGRVHRQGATGAGLGPLPSGYPIAGKTGTSNVANGNGTPYAAFAGYTTALVSYTSVFNPVSPTRAPHDGRIPGFLFPQFRWPTAVPGRDVRRRRARLDLAADVRLGQPRRVARLRDGLPEQRAVEQGQRPGRRRRRRRSRARAARPAGAAAPAAAAGPAAAAAAPAEAAAAAAAAAACAGASSPPSASNRQRHQRITQRPSDIPDVRRSLAFVTSPLASPRSRPRSCRSRRCSAPT